MEGKPCFSAMTWITLMLCLSTVSGWFFGDRKTEGSVTCHGVTYYKKDPYDSKTLPFPECFNTYFRYGTRSCRNCDILISKDDLGNYPGGRKAVFIVHGFTAKYTDDWVVELRNALLDVEDINVITVDWDEGSDRLLTVGYDNAAANARVAGRAVFEMMEALGLDRTTTHCIGHSLGAHVCGYAGKYEKFGRISALDPAGPELQNLKPGARLSADDADLVDVIHTDGRDWHGVGLGTLIAMGDLDFYANDGQRQPGCSRPSLIKFDITCSHSVVVDYYIESVKSRKCVANKLYQDIQDDKELFEKEPTSDTVFPIAGYHADEFANYPGRYGFTTRAQSPYCG